MSQTVDAGYSAQSTYIYAYFRQQHPVLLRWTQLLAGIQAPTIRADAAHLELGFGQGLGLAITAAATAEPQVGVDFMPAQVAALQQLLTNSQVPAVLHAADFGQFLAINQQRFQSISLHGVWSWVSADVRQQIIDIIRLFLAEDGMVYLSHNVLPGCASVLPMQRLIHHTADLFSDADDEGLSTALSALHSMMPLSRYVADTPSLQAWWQSLAQEHPRYLAHEYLGHAWTPMLFQDTADLLAQAGLTFACSADAIEQLTDLHFTEAQQAWLASIPNAALRESYADVMRHQTFRRDIWRRQVTTLSADEQQQQLLDTSLVLLHPIESIATDIQGDLGQFALPQPLTEQLLAYLASHDYVAKSVRDMVQYVMSAALLQPKLDAASTLRELLPLLQALTAMGAIHPAQTEIDAQQLQATQALNQQLMQFAWQDGRIGYLASAVAQSGVQVSRLQQLALLARQATATDCAQAWLQWLAQAEHITDDMFANNQSDLLSELNAFIRGRLPLLIALAVI